MDELLTGTGDGGSTRSGRVRASQHALARDTVALVLAGGRGSRLYELTEWRAKPAVPFGGKFRIIDFAMSNCVNSGIRRIGVLTQYQSQSLNQHVQRAWSFMDSRFGDFVELLPAQERATTSWYLGTANAVHQNMEYLARIGSEYVLVLAGDHVYKMDYAKMLEDHVNRGAELTIASVDVPLDEARGFGVMSVDDDQRVVSFAEKPAVPTPAPGRLDVALASMGVYVFNRRYLQAVLEADAVDPDSSHDFGKDVIPKLIANGARVFAHRFVTSCVNMADGRPYWRDVGTLDAYWAANMELTAIKPDLNIYDQAWPIWTFQEQLPPAKFVFEWEHRKGFAVDSMVASGCIVSGATVRRSMLFSRVIVHSYCTVEDSVLLAGVDLGRGCIVRRTILDRGCQLPPGMHIGVDPDFDRKYFRVTDKGVVLVTARMLQAAIERR